MMTRIYGRTIALFAVSVCATDVVDAAPRHRHAHIVEENGGPQQAETTIQHTTPDSPDWPMDDVWQEELAALLSPEASLLGPFIGDPRIFDGCAAAGNDPFAIREAANGVCMQAPKCQYQFCRPDLVGEDPESLETPAYVLDPRTPEDISVALQFAGRHGVPVSVKNTGHSYHTASLARNSLLIWMTHFPKDDTITEDFQDSCQDQSYTVVGVGGGEIFDDVINAVGPDYHLVTGACRTVGFAGWLMGGGLSYTSRQYGLGVDNVIAFDVVLPNGDIVRADACNNPDLFWALRGGGGGTFGVITHIDYRLHPRTPIVYIQWQLGGIYNHAQYIRHVEAWFEFLLDIAPRLDPRWGGNWDTVGMDFHFMGTIGEARASFLDEFDSWYRWVYRPHVEPNFFFGPSRPSNIAQEFDSWYDLKGGAAAYRNPAWTPNGGPGYESGFDSSRLVTAKFLRKDRDREALLALMIQMARDDHYAPYASYMVGGNIANVDKDETSVHPNLREAVLVINTVEATAGRALRELIPAKNTGVSYNHHSTVEPLWREVLWGGKKEYRELLRIKEEVDPNRVLNCWHCVGYQGEEMDVDTLGVENEATEEAPCTLYFFEGCVIP